jgi:outer membrane lipoprotein carrier protein
MGKMSMAGPGIGRAVRAAVLLASACLSIGWGSTWEELKSAAGTIKSVQAEFVQEKHMKILARPLVSSGLFYFQAPACLRWEYRDPLRNILLMTSEGTERYVGTDSGFVKDAGVNLQAMQVVLDCITQWLEGRFDDNPLFIASLEPGPKITLTPRDKSLARMIQRIELLFTNQPGIIESVIIHESLDSFTTLVFKNVVLNPSLDGSIFRKIS